MKAKMKKSFFIATALIGSLFTACENGDWSFPDYKYRAVYFAYQSPIRTITLGEDNTTDNTLDNLHQCQIMATIGGVYENGNDVTIGVQVDNSLCDGFVYKESGKDILPLPATHYTLEDNQIVIRKGQVLGGVKVQFTDAFFNDQLSTDTAYVIPLRMTNVQNADSILQGKPKQGVSNPNRVNAEDWEILPKDYVLYAVKYINRYDSHYLRRGKDVYSGNRTGTVFRHAQYVEKDETVDGFSTVGLNQVEWKRNIQDAEGLNVESILKLDFNDNGECEISSVTSGITASGNGKFVPKGDKQSWGGKDRDVLYLDYTVDYKGITCQTKDTLVVHYRGVKAEWFTPIKK